MEVLGEVHCYLDYDQCYAIWMMNSIISCWYEAEVWWYFNGSDTTGHLLVCNTCDLPNEKLMVKIKEGQ